MDIQVEDMVKNKMFSVNLNCFNRSTKLTKYKCYVHTTWGKVFLLLFLLFLFFVHVLLKRHDELEMVDVEQESK